MFILFLCLYLLNEHVCGLIFNLCPLGSSCVSPSTSRASCISLNEGLCLLCVCVCACARCLRYGWERLCMFIGVRGRALTSVLTATYRPLRGLAECTKDATTSVGSLMCCIDMPSLPFLPLYFFCRPPLSPSQPLDTSVSFIFLRGVAHTPLFTSSKMAFLNTEPECRPFNYSSICSYINQVWTSQRVPATQRGSLLSSLSDRLESSRKNIASKPTSSRGKHDLHSSFMPRFTSYFFLCVTKWKQMLQR